MIQIATLRIRKGKNGEFLVGKLGDASIMIFPNDRKEGVSAPDYRVFIVEDQPQVKKTASTQPQTSQGPRITPRAQPVVLKQPQGMGLPRPKITPRSETPYTDEIENGYQEIPEWVTEDMGQDPEFR